MSVQQIVVSNVNVQDFCVTCKLTCFHCRLRIVTASRNGMACEVSYIIYVDMYYSAPDALLCVSVCV
jgi:hypothetical protein